MVPPPGQAPLAQIRSALWRVALAPVLAVLVSVTFNVWYGTAYIQPLLTETQNERLMAATVLFNLVVFPLAGGLWGWIVFSLRRPFLPAANAELLNTARARAINLPWHFALIVAVSNIAVGLVIHASVNAGSEPVYPAFGLHLAVMVTIAALITITIAFFLIELMVQALIFPLLFAQAKPYETRGALPLTLILRALLMALAGGIGPIIMLLLIGWADDALRGDFNLFRLSVGILGVAFAVISALLFGGLVVTPIRRLSQAARAVARGNLATQVAGQRADEFGLLIDEFNRMVSELRAKERLRETFGLHVGEAAAREILSRDPGLGGQERSITVMFCDIRGFTAASAGRPPAEIVARLNLFLTDMVEIVEGRYGGMVNKFLGDGFMALFGASGNEADHAERAVNAGREMLALQTNRNSAEAEGFRIGIGIHTGPAVVGTIGSAKRLEYTAIGDTVNLASRIESLTKPLERALLFSAATRAALPDDLGVEALGEHPIRGQPQPLALYTAG